jgi:hypothetical protein
MIVARRVCDVRTSHTEIAKANMPTDNDCSTQGLSLSLVDQIVFSRRISRKLEKPSVVYNELVVQGGIAVIGRCSRRADLDVD